MRYSCNCVLYVFLFVVRCSLFVVGWCVLCVLCYVCLLYVVRCVLFVVCIDACCLLLFVVRGLMVVG